MLGNDYVKVKGKLNFCNTSYTGYGTLKLTDMKRNLLLIALLLVSVIGNTQKVSYVNGAYVTESGSAYTGTFTEKFESGNTKAEFNIIKGQPEGYAVFYYENGSKMEAGSYLAGKRNGMWESWNISGVKVSEATYALGVKDGLWQVWDDNGNKRMEMHYINGEKTGTWKMWDDTGLLISERKYTAGS